MTISLIATTAIIAVGGALLWLFVVAPLRSPEAPVTKPAPAPGPEGEEPARPMHGALNLYLAAPERLPAGAARIELTLNEAELADGETRAVIFQGAQRVMLQRGVVEKVLSERVPNGRWTRLRLTFSPAAEAAYLDGRTSGALLQRRQAELAFDAELPVSRTLALFAAVPLEPEAFLASEALTLNVSTAPREAERFVLGGFLLDPRGRGDIWTIGTPTLAAVVKEDIGLDITRNGTGSSGFVPADAPAPNP